MIIWGGANEYSSSDGAKYNPITDSWSAIDNALGAKKYHSKVWTGSEMIVWRGGYGTPTNSLNIGYRYNPIMNTWASTSSVNAPS